MGEQARQTKDVLHVGASAALVELELIVEIILGRDGPLRCAQLCLIYALGKNDSPGSSGACRPQTATCTGSPR